MLCGRSPRDSLVLQGSGVRIVVPGPVRTEPAQIARPVDLVFLAVKATQTAATAQWLAALSGPQTVVCVLQNGIEQLESVTALCPQGRVVPAVVWFPAQAQSDGSVLLRSDARISLPDEAASLVVAQALQGSRCLVDLVSNFRSLAWQKLLQNAAAGLMALTHRRSGMYGRHDISKLTLDYLQGAWPWHAPKVLNWAMRSRRRSSTSSRHPLPTWARPYWRIAKQAVRSNGISATALSRAAAGRAGFRPRSVMSWCRFLLPRATAPADHPCLDDKACDHRSAIRIQPETAGSTPNPNPAGRFFRSRGQYRVRGFFRLDLGRGRESLAEGSCTGVEPGRRKPQDRTAARPPRWRRCM